MIGSGNYTDSFGTLSYIVGTYIGERLHQLTIAEMPNHTHTITYAETYDSSLLNGNYISNGDCIAAYNMTMITNSSGGNQPHNNMPPSIVLHWIMKL